jgi:hypothetical protein
VRLRRCGDHGGGGRLRRLGLLVGGRRHGAPRSGGSPPLVLGGSERAAVAVGLCRWDACASPAVSLPGGGVGKQQQSLRCVGREGRGAKRRLLARVRCPPVPVYASPCARSDSAPTWRVTVGAKLCGARRIVQRGGHADGAFGTGSTRWARVGAWGGGRVAVY